ncbi:putative ATP-dependent RNA helicase DHX57 [Platysternon megacephalum]|uniref:Putative ATP-dependent RNA helicase DHX57 n=1 Tax=Platysternon megacephalum TaxID=55544 RepID=A0A4D9DQF3_9SAUR|nr:putative ATP-dependent RNA helicase DHX57 [Platysternon megacephalum]
MGLFCLVRHCDQPEIRESQMKAPFNGRSGCGNPVLTHAKLQKHRNKRLRAESVAFLAIVPSHTVLSEHPLPNAIQGSSPSTFSRYLRAALPPASSNSCFTTQLSLRPWC